MLLLRDQKLALRLRSLRRVFFMANGAFATHWLNLAHAELRKSASGASVSRLQSLLDLALSSGGAIVGHTPSLSASTSQPGTPGGALGASGISGTPGPVDDEEEWKDDVRVTLAKESMYDFLERVLERTGAADEHPGGAGGSGGAGLGLLDEDGNEEKNEKGKKGKDDKKSQLSGKSTRQRHPYLLRTDFI
jgi:gamma-tubulin complex component 2